MVGQLMSGWLVGWAVIGWLAGWCLADWLAVGCWLPGGLVVWRLVRGWLVAVLFGGLECLSSQDRGQNSCHSLPFGSFSPH